MAAERIFVDTNVLVYATVAESPWHSQAFLALKTMRESGKELWVSSQVIREYLAVMTRPSIMQTPPSLEVLLRTISSFRSYFHVAFGASEALDRLLALIGRIEVGGKQVHDAHIVATMQVYDIPRLLTHNVSDFKRFCSIIEVIPLADVPGAQRVP